MKTQILTVIIAMTLFTSCSSNANKGATTAQDTTKPQPIQKAPDEKTIGKADTLKTDSLILVVKNIAEPGINRGNPNDPSVPKADEKFISVQVWVKNISNKEATLNEDDIMLKDQNDAEYNESTMFAEAIKSPSLFQNSNYTPVFKPNEAKSGWVTYTTSKTSKAAKIVYKNITVKL
jgi:Domain of unknown function (DUF4352)